MLKLNVYTLNEENWSYEQLFRLWREANGDGLEVQFDFSGCGFLRQNAVAFLGGLARLIEYRGGRVEFAWDTTYLPFVHSRRQASTKLFPMMAIFVLCRE